MLFSLGMRVLGVAVFALIIFLMTFCMVDAGRGPS
jgi:hypothetical protein